MLWRMLVKSHWKANKLIKLEYKTTNLWQKLKTVKKMKGEKKETPIIPSGSKATWKC